MAGNPDDVNPAGRGAGQIKVLVREGQPFVLYDCGLAIITDQQAHLGAMGVQASYLVQGGPVPDQIALVPVLQVGDEVAFRCAGRLAIGRTYRCTATECSARSTPRIDLAEEMVLRAAHGHPGQRIRLLVHRVGNSFTVAGSSE